jgi:glyoxylase-like metal-dependent hydrolase (beta-lactamase superfamily II)
MTSRVDHVVTSGTFSLDGETWEVDNNVWILGNDTECLVIDPAHHAGPILAAIDGRQVVSIVCTHGHDDHISAAAELSEATGAPVLLHPADRMLWDTVYPERTPDGELSDGQILTVADAELRVLHTPGHSPGACCLWVPQQALLFTGDTLFADGPGATGRSYSDYDTIVASIRDRLLVLPEETVVLTGHGESSTIATERGGFLPSLDS